MRCGVSEGTVDRALNDREGIKKETKEKILKVAKELGYRPNHLARCLARIILKNPSVIILDEATGSIDTETENLIKQALDVIIKDKTAFIAAHRLSTIRNADRILYIANEGIAEQGNHEELMAKKGLYYALNI